MTVAKCPTYIRAFFVIQTFVYYFAAVTKLHIARHSLTVQLYSTGLKNDGIINRVVYCKRGELGKSELNLN